MDDQLSRKVLRNLRILNGLIIFFSTIIIGAFVAAAFLAFAVLAEVRAAKQSLTDVQEQAKDSLNVKNDLCDNSGTVSTLLKNQSDICAN